MAFGRLTRYVGVSSGAMSFVVWHAFLTREQFFPALQYLSTSKIAIAVAGNFAFAMALCMYRVTVKMFLGQLREAEVERINDRISQAVMETCLAMTIFREEFNVEFCTMFTVLTFVKVFHWLVADRVEYLETTPAGSRLQHVRIVAFMVVLLAIDAAFLQLTVGKTLQRSASVHLLFAFEYVIQASVVLSTAGKYTLAMIDAAMEGRWASKGTYVFYLELVTDMLHLFVYLIFFVIVFANYGLPLHLVRDLYWTFRNFRNRVADFLRYRRVTANMDERFPDATEEELQRADHTCIVCREDMVAGGRNKKLPCNHVFHLHCLRSWLERQQNCPICRTSVFAARPREGAAPAQQPGDPLPAAAGAADLPHHHHHQHQQQQHQGEEGGRPVRYWRVRPGAAQAVPILPEDAAAGAAGQPQQPHHHHGQQQPHHHHHQQQQQQEWQARQQYYAAQQAHWAAAAAAAQQAAARQHAMLQQAQAQMAEALAAQQRAQQAAHGPAVQQRPAEATQQPAQQGGAPAAPQAVQEASQQPGASQAAGYFQQPMGAWPGGYMPGGFGYPMAWNVPQWIPHTSMAMFAPAGYHPFQFAGQQGPGDAVPQQPQFSRMLPVLPMALPPALQAIIPPPPEGASPQQIQNHRAAAAAAAAAAASVMGPYSHMMAPPTLVAPQPSRGGGGGAASGGSAEAGPSASGGAAVGVSPEAAAAAANAAAAAAAAAVISAPSSAGVSVEQLRRRQVDILQAQLQALGPLRPTSPSTSGGGAGGAANNGANLTSPSFPPARAASATAGGAAAPEPGPPSNAAANAAVASAFAAALGSDDAASSSTAGAPASLTTALEHLRRASSRNSELAGSIDGGAAAALRRSDSRASDASSAPPFPAPAALTPPAGSSPSRQHSERQHSEIQPAAEASTAAGVAAPETPAAPAPPVAPAPMSGAQSPPPGGQRREGEAEEQAELRRLRLQRFGSQDAP